jgi:hypothetical protein
MNDENQVLPEGVRDRLEKSRKKVEGLRKRLATNERRILALEGRRRDSDQTWAETVTTADAVIAAVASIEISAGMHTTSSSVDEMSKAALDRTGLTTSDLSHFSHADSASRMGAINLLQGHLGEQMTLDLLHSGGIPGPPGRVPQLASTPNQPGYDISFIDPNHQLETIHAQVKISDSAAAIREHFARYPDVSVVYANSEAAQQIAHDHGVTVVGHGLPIPDHAGHVVVDMGISHDHVRNEALGLLDGGSHHSVTHHILEDIPLVSLLLIAGRAAHAYVDGDVPERVIIRDAGRRARDVILASGLGHAVAATTSEPITGSMTAIGYMILGNALRAARQDISRATARFESSRSALNSMCPI